MTALLLHQIVQLCNGRQTTNAAGGQIRVEYHSRAEVLCTAFAYSASSGQRCVDSTTPYSAGSNKQNR